MVHLVIYSALALHCTRSRSLPVRRQLLFYSSPDILLQDHVSPSSKHQATALADPRPCHCGSHGGQHKLTNGPIRLAGNPCVACKSFSRGNGAHLTIAGPCHVISCKSVALFDAPGAVTRVIKSTEMCWGQVTSVDTDKSHEIIWAGTESGGVYALQSPTLGRYSCSRCTPFFLQRTEGASILLRSAIESKREACFLLKVMNIRMCESSGLTWSESRMSFVHLAGVLCPCQLRRSSCTLPGD